MPRTVPAGLATHLTGEVTTLARLWVVTRKDGVVMRFTDHDEDVLFGGNTYEAAVGYSPTAVVANSQMSVDNLEVESILDSTAVTAADLRDGVYDGAKVQILVVNYVDPDGDGAMTVQEGEFGQIRWDGEVFRVELRGLSQYLQITTGELYTPDCRALLGSPQIWTTGLSVTEGDEVVPTLQVSGDYKFRALNSGTTGGTEPTWPTTSNGDKPGATVADNGITWEAQRNRCGVRTGPPTWAASVSTALRPTGDAKIGSLVSPSTPNGRQFRCSVVGSTGETEPSWDTVVGNTTTEVLTAATWAATTGYTAGDTVNPTTPNGFIFIALNTGTSAGSEPTWPTTLGGTVVDNDITWQALSDTPAQWVTIQALEASGTVTSVTDNQLFQDSARTEADDFWQHGVLTWTSGNNAGLSAEVKDFANSGGAITLFLPAPNTVQVGDAYDIVVGCDKSVSACRLKFDNIFNFRGEPFVPGTDSLFPR